jgi:hypothetical protein
MMQYLEAIDQTSALLRRIGVTVEVDRRAAPVDISILKEVIPASTSIPPSIEQLFAATGGAAFEWYAPSRVFGDGCCRGHAQLLGPLEIAEIYKDQVGTVNDAISEGLVDDSGYAALIEDWPHWLPLFSFRNGDCFCLDTRRPNAQSEFPVILLEHDVMDAGPNLHGLLIARSFPDLLQRWSEVLFVEMRDWSDVVTPNGLNPKAKVFEKMRQRLA